jgi:hypothetical protein
MFQFINNATDFKKYRMKIGFVHYANNLEFLANICLVLFVQEYKE